MKNVNLKWFLYILLGISGLVWFTVARLGNLNLQNFIGFIEPIPKVITVDMILMTVFIKWLWKWRLFQGWLVPFPNLSGTWYGSIQTNWKDAQGNIPGPIPVILTINQKFISLNCVMRSAEMESHSYVEGFQIDKDAQIKQLCYSYTSKPNILIRERSAPHDGTVLLNIVGRPVYKLEGEYWTQRHTTGKIQLVFKSRELLDELPGDMPMHPMSE